MIRFVPFDFKKHAFWVKQLIQPIFCEDTKGIVAERDGVPVGAMLGDSWTKNSVNIHIGITDPLCFKHKMHHEFAKWVFIDCDRKQVIGLTPSNNAKAIKMYKHLGFVEIGRLPDAYDDGVDYIITRIKREDCKYLPKVKENRKVA